SRCLSTTCDLSRNIESTSKWQFRHFVADPEYFCRIQMVGTLFHVVAMEWADRHQQRSSIWTLTKS
ncbi:MAG: hypothetical protein NT028_09270, partial [candidate division Zixibacteria bacterium]|nr:hypothetical protein [candidate division Zixibacteria bacterium]